MAPSVAPSLLEKEARAIFQSPTFDLDNETQKTIRKKISQRLGLDKFPADKKRLLKDIVKRLIDEQDDENEKENTDNDPLEVSDDEEEQVESKPKKLTKKKQTPNKKATKKTADASSNKASYSSSVQSLLNLGQAMRLGPRLHRGLKEMKNDKERVVELTERLQAAGAKWKGALPTPQDIAKAKEEKKKMDDLDGLDTSLIIEGGRRRGRGGSVVNYAVDDAQSSDSDDHEEEQEQKRPRKKSKAKTCDSSSDEDVEASDLGGSQSSDSEAEFE